MISPDCLIPKGFPLSLLCGGRICGAGVSDISQSLPVTPHTPRWKATVLIISPACRSKGPCLVQPAQVNPIFWSPISCCAVWFGMHSVLSCFLCIHIFIPTQRLETWLRFPRKNLGQWQSQGKKLTNKSFHFPAVSIHRCRDFGYTFNSFCDLGKITCLPLDFSLLISKARGWTRKISYNSI